MGGQFTRLDVEGLKTYRLVFDLEHRRDILDNLQMLWWIQQEDLKHHLRFWSQLLQFFRIYRLEDELWRGITMEEIQADIDFIKDITKIKCCKGNFYKANNEKKSCIN